MLDDLNFLTYYPSHTFINVSRYKFWDLRLWGMGIFWTSVLQLRSHHSFPSGMILVNRKIVQYKYKNVMKNFIKHDVLDFPRIYELPEMH